jgi:hypothetical protein
MLRQFIATHAATASDPWIVPLTVLGPKMADRRLVNQQRSMKTMYQGSDMYTPACAGYATEDELMEYFNLLVNEFLKIEAQQFCVVNDKEYTVYIMEIEVTDSGLVRCSVLARWSPLRFLVNGWGGMRCGNWNFPINCS